MRKNIIVTMTVADEKIVWMDENFEVHVTGEDEVPRNATVIHKRVENPVKVKVRVPKKELLKIGELIT